MNASELHQRLSASPGDAFVETLFDFMTENGQTNYDESVTQLEHALQAAQLARERHTDPQFITAALLHDLGHFLLDEHAATAEFLTADLHHEEIGATFLADFFPAEVHEPIRLHVPAKRYLCTVDESYYNQLSEASKRSFQVQGGPLSADEREQLDSSPHLARALELRRIDDRSKKADHDHAPIADFRSEVLTSLS